MTTSEGKIFRPYVVAVTLLVILALPLYMISLNARSERASVQSFSGPTMGTRYTVSVASDRFFDVVSVQRRVDERLVQINQRMSTYDPESELSRFNRLNNNDWFSVSPETAKVVATALEIAERTSGAFDPTVGPVVNLWGFGPDKSRMVLPEEEEIATALARVGYENVSVRSNPPALKKSNPEIYLDLSGIAKGYASDEISELLEKLGYADSMVEIGGEVRTRGAKADGLPWRIGVERPDAAGRQVYAAVNLDNAGMATSGDYRNFFEHEGIRYSHTIDPFTGRPVQHSLAAVSIISTNCMDADALATAVLVMGDEKGYDWCVKEGVSAMFLVREGEQIVERATPSFQELIATK